MKKPHLLRGWGAVGLACLALAGCGQGLGEEPAEPDRVLEIPGDPQEPFPLAGKRYTIYLDNQESWVVDQAGNVVGEEHQFDVLRDELDASPQCLVRNRQEDTGERDTNGNPVVRHTSALYDLDGALLRDWEEITYRQGFGDFIIRQERRSVYAESWEIPGDYYTALWNFRTQKDHLEGVDTVETMGDGETILLRDVRRCALGVADSRGAVVSGFPPPADYYDAEGWNGRILARTKGGLLEPEEDNGQGVLLTRDFQEILRREWLNGTYIGLYGEYLTFSDERDEQGVLSAQGELLYQVNQGYLEYFDGELVVIQTGEHYLEEDPALHRLETVQGKVLAKGYSLLEPAADYRQNEPSQLFFGEKDGCLSLLDRRGKVIATREIPGVSYMSYLADGLYAYTVEDEAGNYGQGVVDGNLEDVIPLGTYHSLYKASSWGGGEWEEYDLLQGYRMSNGSDYVDILDFQGNLVIGGLVQVYDWGPNRIAVRKGFEIGLMDWQGDWIAKESIFHGLIDD